MSSCFCWDSDNRESVPVTRYSTVVFKNLAIFTAVSAAGEPPLFSPFEMLEASMPASVTSLCSSGIDVVVVEEISFFEEVFEL